MKLFQCVQKFYRMLGVYPPQHNQISTINPRNLLIICNLAQGFILTGAYGLFEAKTVREYGDCYYTSTTSLSHSIYVAIHIWTMAKILKLIGRFEGIIQQSKLEVHKKLTGWNQPTWSVENFLFFGLSYWNDLWKWELWLHYRNPKSHF